MRILGFEIHYVGILKSQRVKREVRAVLLSKGMVAAMQCHRSLTGAKLIDTKKYVEAIRYQEAINKERKVGC